MEFFFALSLVFVSCFSVSCQQVLRPEAYGDSFNLENCFFSIDLKNFDKLNLRFVSDRVEADLNLPYGSNAIVNLFGPISPVRLVRSGIYGFPSVSNIVFLTGSVNNTVTINVAGHCNVTYLLDPAHLVNETSLKPVVNPYSLHDIRYPNQKYRFSKDYHVTHRKSGWKQAEQVDLSHDLEDHVIGIRAGVDRSSGKRIYMLGIGASCAELDYWRMKNYEVFFYAITAPLHSSYGVAKVGDSNFWGNIEPISVTHFVFSLDNAGWVLWDFEKNKPFYFESTWAEQSRCVPAILSGWLQEIA